MEETAPPPKPPTPKTSGSRLLLGLTLVGVTAFVGSVAGVWYLLNQVDTGEVQEGSFLDVELGGLMTDAPGAPGLFEEPDDVAPTVTEIAHAIRRAADDDRIDGLLLRLNAPAAGWAAFQELRTAVDAFRASDKPCVAYGESVFTNKDYYLATACDQVLVNPAGALFVTGLSMELTYYKGMFDKVGVEPEFEHVGDFKSFIEAYERTGPSESAAEANEYLLDSLYEQFVAGIAEGRDAEADTVKSWIDRPSMTPDGALERGMLDGVAYPDALLSRVANVGDEGWMESLVAPVDEVDTDGLTDLGEYLKGLRAEEQSGAPIAVVYAEGDITSGGSEPSMFGDSGSLTDGEFSEWMEEVREDDDIEAVVVRVSSRGGSGLAAAQMWREVARTKAAGKPVVVSFGDYAASGGYLMSCNADAIVSQPGTITGSIGVFGGKFALAGVYEKMGMDMHTFKRGELSDMLSFSSPFSDDGRMVFREYLTSFYDVFISQVAEGRDMTPEAVHEVAQGRVWTGTQALERGLVDQLGGLDDAIALAAEKAGIDDTRVRRVPARKSFIDLVLEDMAQASVPVDVQLPFGVSDAAVQELRTLESIQSSGGVGAMLPGRMEIR